MVWSVYRGYFYSHDLHSKKRHTNIILLINKELNVFKANQHYNALRQGSKCRYVIVFFTAEIVQNLRHFERFQFVDFGHKYYENHLQFVARIKSGYVSTYLIQHIKLKKVKFSRNRPSSEFVAYMLYGIKRRIHKCLLRISA